MSFWIATMVWLMIATILFAGIVLMMKGFPLLLILWVVGFIAAEGYFCYTE